MARKRKAAAAAENDYERERDERIAANKERMKTLGIADPPAELKPAVKKKPAAKKAKMPPAEPTRRSSRARGEVSYKEKAEGDIPAAPPVFKHPSTYDPDEPVKPARYLTPAISHAPGGEAIPCDKDGRLKFSDHPEFQPNLTPRQMIHAGIFGGCYFNPRGGKPGVKHPKGIPGVSHKEYPKDWFAGLPEHMYLSRRYNLGTNCYGVKAGQDQVYWEEHGWIHPQDPRGWFQWYSRFYLGRRTDDDERQIGRWNGVCGPKGRWKRALVNKCLQQRRAYNDAVVSPVIRQTLLHWGYELTEKDHKAMSR